MCRPSGQRSCAALLAVLSAGCTDSVPPRAQLVIVVDTDAHMLGEILTRPDVSPDGAVDTLRVDILDPTLEVNETQIFRVFSSTDWPLSFGVLPSATTDSVARVRLRLFRSEFAQADEGTLSPPAEVTIDRLLVVDLPEKAIRRVGVFLSMECLGEPARMGTEPATCVDAQAPAADPSTGPVDLDGITGNRVGSWPVAIERPCRSSPAGHVCIPGGFAVLGDVRSIGESEWTFSEPRPLRPVSLSPFLLDRHEFTVGRLRELLVAGAAIPQQPALYDPRDPLARHCTWLGLDDPAHDEFPLVCVQHQTAARVCELLGGALPTEAQWEYAGRGRGERRLFPWGNDAPSCCMASFARVPDVAWVEGSCGVGIERVGAHEESIDCAAADVTRDGVADMAGGVAEATLDRLAGYAEPCWTGARVLHDPVCTEIQTTLHVARGGHWNSTELELFLRDQYMNDNYMGFRCAYPDE